MRLAMRLPQNTAAEGPANDSDPRDSTEAEVIDLASRNAYPAVSQRKGVADGLGMVAGIALVAGLGLVTLWSMNSARLAEPESVGAPLPEAQPLPAPVAQSVARPQAVTAPAPAAPRDPAPAPVLARAPQVNAGPISNPFSNPTVVFDSGAAPAAAVAAGAPAGAPNAPATPANSGNSSSDFASRIGGVGGATAQAQAMTNPSTTVTQGTLIPAILETGIDTNVPGFVRAVVSQDVRSFDGTKVLVPRSSRLIGQYQSGLQNGQKRAYVIWTRLIRPDGASVNLASPAIGFDGTTGLQGEVSSNFFSRFGSALLLSVVGGLGAIASGGTSAVILGGAGQSAASVAAQQDGQVGPTVRVRQGEPIRIFTARDLDFTSVN